MENKSSVQTEKGAISSGEIRITSRTLVRGNRKIISITIGIIKELDLGAREDLCTWSRFVCLGFFVFEEKKKRGK